MPDLLGQLGINANFSAVILVWALLMGRVLPLILFAPFIGGDLVPQQVKMGVGIALSILLYPFVADTKLPTGSIAFVLLLLKEVFIGLSIAFVATAAFDAARSAGTLVDTFSGANMATVYVPQLGTQATLYADFKFQLTVVMFLALNGHHLVIQSLFESFKVVPLNSWPRFGHGFWPFFELVIKISSQLMLVAIALSAPSSIATFVTDLALGLVNRVAPQIQVFFISMAVKPMVVAMMTLASLLVLQDEITKAFGTMMRELKMMIFLFS
jgi:flagellar biosynthetic protein FliR